MKKWLTNNIGLKLLSLVAATLLWLIVQSIADPVATRRFQGITVQTQNESMILNQGKIYQVTNNATEVIVTVSARRSVLRQIRTSDIQAYADFQNMELSSMVPIAVSIPAYEGQYESAVASPNNLVVSIEDAVTSKFPVSVSVEGTPAEGYFVESTTLSPDTITISGPASLVSEIDKVTVPIEVTGISTNKTDTIMPTILDKAGNAIDISRVSTSVDGEGVEVTAVILEEKTVAVSASTSGEPAQGYTVKNITCEPGEVAITGTQEAMDRISKLEIPAEAIDVTGLDANMEVAVDLTKYLPAGISLADERDARILVTLTIESQGHVTIEYPISSIVINNVPRGLRVNYGNAQEVRLVMTGDDSVIESLTKEDLTVSIDLKDYSKEGEYTVPVSVTSTKGVELVQEKQISITLEKEGND